MMVFNMGIFLILRLEVRTNTKSKNGKKGVFRRISWSLIQGEYL